jgi:FlaA1/EpsC-like NDP-sugar epimerase
MYKFSSLNKDFLEKKIISAQNRFIIKNYHTKELRDLFLKKNILVTGASGSIGSKFSLSLLKFRFKKLFLLDKNENDLALLNRKIVKEHSTKNIDFICVDINAINLNNFLIENKINLYLNFAAIKHVRSEENLYSIKYMFSTNYESFYNINCKTKYLKKIFSISTDKAADPSSLMGISKLMMEHKLKNIIKNTNISVCSARFANVSFSRGSILDYALECIKKKVSFGIPSNIKRYFITHDEAVSICYHALLKKNNNSIVIPNKYVLGKQISIKDIITKILKIYNYKFIYKKFSNKRYKNNKNYHIYLTGNNIVGQKMFEKFSSDYEDSFIIKSDSVLDKLSLKNLEFVNLDIYKKLKLLKSIKRFKYLLQTSILGYKFKSKQIKVSQII